jgi:SAM (Sterile alpha motif) domain-containing protein
MDLGGWLRNLGLERYEGAFRENEIDETVLPNVTAEDLKELGVSALGHRRKLLDAIAALRADTGAKSPSADVATTSSAPSVAPEERAERRFSGRLSTNARPRSFPNMAPFSEK